MKLIMGILGTLLMGSAVAQSGDWRLESSQTTEATPQLIKKTAVKGRRRVTLTLCAFASRDFTLQVVDQGNSKSARPYRNLREAMTRTGCVAGVNGGFFGSDFKPLGLVIENGKQVARFSKTTRGGLASGVLWSGTGGIHIERMQAFRLHSGVLEAVQTGPMLIWQGARVRGLSDAKWRPRSFVLTDWRGNWMLGMSSSVSLAALSELLDSPAVMTEFTVNRAINLDGGRSSGFYLKQNDGNVASSSEFSTVRNFVGIRKK